MHKLTFSLRQRTNKSVLVCEQFAITRGDDAILGAGDDRDNERLRWAMGDGRCDAATCILLI